MQNRLIEEDGNVTVPCPDPECNEMYDLSTINKPDSLVNSCDGCNKKIWLHWDLNPNGVTIYLGDGGKNNHSQRYRRTIENDTRVWILL